MKLLIYPPLLVSLLMATTFETSSKIVPIQKQVKTTKIVTIDAQVISTNPFRVTSSELTEVNATIEGTNTQTHGYVLASETHKMKSGYFFYGQCLVFGILFTDDNTGQQIFAPCGFSCVGSAFGPICPADGNGLARFTFETTE